MDMMKKRFLVPALVLLALTLIVYWNVQYFSFINYDDYSYVRDYSQVTAGLTWNGLGWAMTDIHTGYWHPLTWLSHMLDWQLFRFNAGGHHWSSLVLHLFNTLLVFAVFQAMTKETGKCAVVAALFALHPLNVESVTWVAERKNVLSTFWGLLSVYFYVLYTQRPLWGRYLCALLAFALGLMAKPMLVTLPCVLLLLDCWPLERFPRGWAATGLPNPSGARTMTLSRLILEKVPLLILTVLVSAGTFWAVRHVNAVTPLDILPLGFRVKNAVVSYAAYIGKMIWPAKLAIFYPYTAQLSFWYVGACALVLILITVAVARLSRKHPYLVTGWLWYLGTLVPVIGIVQAGDQAMADRYAYLPLIGLFVMIAWGIPDLTARWRWRKEILTLALIAVMAGMAVTTWRQVQHWENNITLFRHVIDVSEANHVAHNNLGVALMEEGRLDEAMVHYKRVIEINPWYVWGYNNIGVVLLYQGKSAAATAYFRKALQIHPRYAEAHNNLGIALARQGMTAEATRHFQEALRINPSFADARFNLQKLGSQSGDRRRKGKNDERG